MRADPGDAAQKQDDERRNGPDDHLDRPGILPVWTIGGPPIARPEPPGKRQRQHDDRNDDREHDRGGVVENDALRLTNRAVWIEHAFTARGDQATSAKDAADPCPLLDNTCADPSGSPRANGIPLAGVAHDVRLHESQPRVHAPVRTIGFRCMRVSRKETKRSVFECGRTARRRVFKARGLALIQCGEMVVNDACVVWRTAASDHCRRAVAGSHSFR